MQAACLSKFHTLGAARSVQAWTIPFSTKKYTRRANCKGCKSIVWRPNRRDAQGMLRPLANCFYDRAKNRNGVNPLRLMELVELTVICTCIGEHQPLRVIMAPRGEPDSLTGNERCWYNQLEYCRMDQDNECTDRIFRYCVQQSHVIA